MIRRRDNPALIIPQTAHGWLAGQVALNWGNRLFFMPSQLPEVILAAAIHDQGWLAWEQSPQLNGAGVPTDFMEMPVPAHVELWQQSVQSVAAQNLYAGLLVSKHACFLIDNRLKTQPDPADWQAQLQTFLQTQQSWQDQLLAQLRCTDHFAPACEPERLQANLRLLQVFDWFSLLLCMQPVQPTVIPDVPGADFTDRISIRLSPGAAAEPTLTVDPWPFSRPRFTLTVQAHRLAGATFASDAAFQQIWQQSPVEILNFVFERTV